MAVGMPDEWSVERSIAPIASEWRSFQAEAVGTPFQSYEWVSNLLVQPEDARGAVFVLGRKSGELRVLFPLVLLGGRLTWLGETWNNYNMPLVARDLFESLDAEDVDNLWRQVRTQLGNPAASLLRRQPTVVADRPNPFAEWSRVREPTGSYAITLGAEWKSFYETLHSKTTRRTLGRKRKKLEQDGALAILRIEDPALIHAHVLQMLVWKSDQLDADGRRNLFATSANREIMARFAANHLTKSRVYAMHLDGKPIAISFLIEADRHLILYQTAYDHGPASRSSPGKILLDHVMEMGVRDHHAVLDLSVGDDLYKREVCDRTMEMTNSVKAHALAGLPAVARERAGTALKAAIKSNPQILHAVLKVNAARRVLLGPSPGAAGSPI